jgi:hypothetical protein
MMTYGVGVGRRIFFRLVMLKAVSSNSFVSFVSSRLQRGRRVGALRALLGLRVLLALLALLLPPTLAGGCDLAPTSSSVTARAMLGASHDPTSIDDDDDQDDDTVTFSMFATPADDDKGDDADANRDDEASALPQPAGATRGRTLDAYALSMLRRGLRPSGEHRTSADRPPRA